MKRARRGDRYRQWAPAGPPYTGLFPLDVPTLEQLASGRVTPRLRRQAAAALQALERATLRSKG